MSVQEVSGRCLCGSVTVTLTPAKPHLEACHCAMCRRWCGSAYIAVQSDANVTLTGEEHVTRYPSSEWAERGFCSKCGSNLFYHFLPTGSYSFLAGLFDDLGSMTLGEEIFVDEQPPYYTFAQDTVRKTGAEIIAEAKEAGFSFD
ncbi:GFA family protein [Altererythrobacter lutimaris]|uniref:GFA family protein n=1 Tax=Altererythrobacter lutimaris TaxID=2743979 RepID=A0A850HFE6_9SPHN|nr:GFA family protein [Altererythrobacter lutimaris]NVE95936.1 GFA family protein [Altererythrobacter lutimaris]